MNNHTQYRPLTSWYTFGDPSAGGTFAGRHNRHTHLTSWTSLSLKERRRPLVINLHVPIDIELLLFENNYFHQTACSSEINSGLNVGDTQTFCSIILIVQILVVELRSGKITSAVCLSITLVLPR